MWRSLVARIVRDDEVAGSNPVTPTKLVTWSLVGGGFRNQCAAQWCSTDPVCVDAGEKGQSPESCNLAACHGCALLPETACEEFNRFLDRGLVVGTFDNPSLGYFADFGV